MSPTHGRTHWKLVEDCRHDTTQRQEEEPETHFARSCSPGRSCLLQFQVGIERWEYFVSRHEKKLKDTSDDEIAEQATETTMEHVELEFTPSSTNVERCVPYLEFMLQQTWLRVFFCCSSPWASMSVPLKASRGFASDRKSVYI